MTPSDNALLAASLQLARHLIEGWRTLALGGAGDGSEEMPPMRAFILLNRWDDNLLAEAIEAAFPKNARERRSMLAERFKHREERAPCFIELPDLVTASSDRDSLAAQALQDFLAQCLAFAWKQTTQRNVKQDLGAVVFSRAPADRISAHWERMSRQRSPIGDEFRLIRYQDPRAMQRAWPLLTADQQRRWLGPVVQWWALLQPWGPWAPADYLADDSATTSDDAQWFQAIAPPLRGDGWEMAHESTSGAFLNASQWQALHISPDANHVWAGYANARVAARDQPDGDTVVRLLADGARLGLTGGDLHDYVWCTWRHEAPDGAAREIAWQTGAARAVLADILRSLKLQPEARFATLYLQAMRQRRA